MYYLVGIFRISSLGESISINPEGTALRRQGEEPDYIKVLQQRAGSLSIKRLLLIKKNQISQVKEFRTFLCMGRFKSLGSLKLILLYVSQLTWGQCPVFFTSWASLGLTIGSAWSLKAARSQVLFSFLSAPRAHQATLEACKHWLLWHPCLLMQEIFLFLAAISNYDWTYEIKYIT